MPFPRFYQFSSSPKQKYSPLIAPIYHQPNVQAASTPNISPHPSNQFDPNPATNPSNPRFGVHEARAVKLEPREAVFGPRLKVRGPRTYVLGPWPSDHGPGFRQDINTSIYNKPSVTTARAEHHAFPKSSSERGNNSEHNKAASNLRRLYI